MLLKIVKGIWIITCVAVLLVSFYYFSPDPKNDIEIFLIWSMIFLSFPIGYVVAVFFNLVAIFLIKFSGVTLSNSYLSIFIVWFTFFAAGYVQWFVLAPKLVQWIKNKKKLKPFIE